MKILKNSIWIVSCKLIKAILTLIITMISARLLGPSKYGLIGYAASIVTFFTPIMKLGFDAILVHEIINNRENEGKILGSAIYMSIISSLICIIFIALFTSIINYGEKETILVCILYSVLLLFEALELIQYWFQSKLLSKYSSIAMLISYIII